MFRLALGLIVGVLLISCGQEVCIGPFGNCWQRANEQAGGGTGGTGVLTITAPTAVVNAAYQVTSGQANTLTASGGSGMNYVWSTSSTTSGATATLSTTSGATTSFTLTGGGSTGQSYSSTVCLRDSTGGTPKCISFTTVN
ncbi:hypothetical protein K2X33_12610 [bacterium]|nr:hypothetical protein [bacterium]